MHLVKSQRIALVIAVTCDDYQLPTRHLRSPTGGENKFASYDVTKMTKFSEIVDAADNLSVDEQEGLVEILRRRIAQRNRMTLTQEVSEARAEFLSGNTPAISVRDLMDEVSGES